MRVFTLDDVVPHDRPAALAAAFAAYPIPLSLDLSCSGRLQADFERSATAFATIESFHVSGASGVAQRGALRDSALPDLVTVHLERAGHATLLQDGRAAAPRPGDLVLSSTWQPFATRQEAVSEQRTISFAASDLHLDFAAVRNATARVLDGRDPVFGVVSRYLDQVAYAALHDGDPLAALGPVTIEMVRILIATVSADESRLRASLAPTLGERVVVFIDVNLCDPELSATTIAQAHSISVRYLYVLLRQQGVNLGEHIRSGRVAHAQGLMATAGSAMPLAEVARRSGFSDYSSFARAFRAVAGMSPREFRADTCSRVHESRSSVHAAPKTPPEVPA